MRACLVFMSLGLLAPWTHAHAANAGIAEVAQKGAVTASSINISDDDIRTFVSVFRTVKEAYVEPVEDNKLMHSAIRGLLAGLDPHSQYLEPSELQQWDQDTRGVYGGLGVEVIMADGYLRIIAPIDDTPASRAGIRAGDIILAIDGVPIESNDARAVDRLRGAAGSSVKLALDRDGEQKPIEVNLIREVIKARSVKLRELQPGYASLRISQFQETTAHDVREHIRRIKSAKTPLRGLILDLRNNPGGVLTAAVEVADAFLDKGIIVTTRGRMDEAKIDFSASAGDVLDGAPLIVLVDEGSASASEIVAGALKDHHRAVIMGQRTFGKGSVQNILPLESGGAVKLTTARYFTPLGASIQAQGIEPDIEIADMQLAPIDRGAILIATEAGLPGSLQSDDSDTEKTTLSEAATGELSNDYVLGTALNALKAIVIATCKAEAATDC